MVKGISPAAKSENEPGSGTNPAQLARGNEPQDGQANRTNENSPASPLQRTGSSRTRTEPNRPAAAARRPAAAATRARVPAHRRQSSGTAPDGDAANLEYARKQTDLVLEKLADQMNRKKVDEQMLKELGWTEDDLRAFVERWQRRKEAARNANPAADAARRELDDALRSLGLRRGTLRQNKVQDDRDRDLREGYRGPVPLGISGTAAGLQPGRLACRRQ